MKYIEVPQLSRIAQALTHEGPECNVHTRLEAYSCKNVKRDKKLFKSLELAYHDDVSTNSLPSWLALDKEADLTPFGPFGKHASRKTLYLLIATLNIAFPDYEFSDVSPAQFSREQSGATVLNALSTTFATPQRSGSLPRTYASYPPTSPAFFPSSVPSSSSPYDQIKPSPHALPPIVSGTHPTLFRAVDDVIGLADCEVYSYSPDIESDPHANDSDDEDDLASLPDEDSSDEDDSPVFDFDDYDIDEIDRRSSSPSIPLYTSSGPKYSVRDYSPSHGRSRHRSALLWSSHWFFLNRKLKRILFISVWARSKGISRSWSNIDLEDRIHSASGERFLGWEGAHGAGARALGLRAAA